MIGTGEVGEGEGREKGEEKEERRRREAERGGEKRRRAPMLPLGRSMLSIAHVLA